MSTSLFINGKINPYLPLHVEHLLTEQYFTIPELFNFLQGLKALNKGLP